jgi:hypothetical protein
MGLCSRRRRGRRHGLMLFRWGAPSRLLLCLRFRLRRSSAAGAQRCGARSVLAAAAGTGLAESSVIYRSKAVPCCTSSLRTAALKPDGHDAGRPPNKLLAPYKFTFAPKVPTHFSLPAAQRCWHGDRRGGHPVRGASNGAWRGANDECVHDTRRPSPRLGSRREAASRGRHCAQEIAWTQRGVVELPRKGSELQWERAQKGTRLRNAADLPSRLACALFLVSRATQARLPTPSSRSSWQAWRRSRRSRARRQARLRATLMRAARNELTRPFSSRPATAQLERALLRIDALQREYPGRDAPASPLTVQAVSELSKARAACLRQRSMRFSHTCVLSRPACAGARVPVQGVGATADRRRGRVPGWPRCRAAPAAVLPCCVRPRGARVSARRGDSAVLLRRALAARAGAHAAGKPAGGATSQRAGRRGVRRSSAASARRRRRRRFAR